MDLNDLLLRAVNAGATDVHLKLGRPPILRRDGALVPLENWNALTPADL
jgi:twitching motility protein PilT